MTGKLRSHFLILPAALLVGLFLVVPYLNIVVMSLRSPAPGQPFGQGFSATSYLKFFADTYYSSALLSTLWLGILTTVITALLAFPVALQISRMSNRWRWLAFGIVLSPMLVGIVVRSFGWTILLGNNGVLNRAFRGLGMVGPPVPLMYNSLGIVIALVHVFLPLMVLPILASLQSIDPALEQAARSLGASRLTCLRRITLPLALPGLQAGSILVFVAATSAYVTPILVGGLRVKTMAVIVVDTLIDQFDWPFGSALALIMGASAALVVAAFQLATRVRWR